MLIAHDAPVFIDAVTLTVRDLATMTSFYERAIGLRVAAREAGETRLSAGDATILRLVENADATRPPRGSPGLFHTAFLLPDRASLADWLRHAAETRIPLEGASDHLVSEALYLSDPEGNGIEIYCDRNRDEWPFSEGRLRMATDPLDLGALLADAVPTTRPFRIADGAAIGHVHLCVGDVAAGQGYLEGLGFSLTTTYPGAAFLSTGGYHHHLAVNAWRSGGRPLAPAPSTGLAEVALRARDDGARAALSSALAASPTPPWGGTISLA